MQSNQGSHYSTDYGYETRDANPRGLLIFGIGLVATLAITAVLMIGNFEPTVSRTAEKTLGLREIAELGREEALERIVIRTRRYAAYQRKWMRRIPGIAVVDADRDPIVVAEDVLALERVG